MADRPLRRRLLSAVLLGLGLGGIVAAVLWIALPVVASRIVVDHLAAIGVPAPRLEVVRVGVSRAVAVGFSAGAEGELTARQIVVDYRFPDVLEGDVEAITIRDPVLRASIGPDGLRLGSLDVLVDGEAGTPQFIPPIVLEGAAVELTTAHGPVRLTGNGSIMEASGTIAADIELAASAPQGNAAGVLRVQAAASDIEARLALAELQIVLPDFVAATAAGEMTVRLATDELAALDGHLSLGSLQFSDPRLADLGTLAGTMTVHGAPGDWRASLALSDASDSTRLDLRLAIPDLSLDREATVAVDLDASAEAPLWGLLGLPQPATGFASGNVVAVLTPARLVDATRLGRVPELKGSASLDIRDLTYPGAVHGFHAVAGMDIEAEDGRTVRLSASGPILAEGTIDRKILDELPAGVAAVLAQSLAASIDLVGPVELHRDGAETIIRGAPAFAVDLASGTPLLDARGAVEVRIGAAPRPAVDVTGLEGRIDLPEGTALIPGNITFVGSFSTHEKGEGADLALAFQAPRISAGALRATDLKVGLPVRVEHADGRLSVRLSGRGALSVARLSGTAPLQLAGPVQLGFIPDDLPFLAMNFIDSDAPRAVLKLRSGPIRLAGSIETADGPVEGRLSFPGLQVQARLDAYGWSGKLSGAEGTLTVPTHQVEATDLDVAVEFAAGEGPHLAMTSALAHRADPALVVPLSASLSARRVPQGWAFTGRATDAFGRLSIAVEGRHDLARSSGTGKLRVSPIEFAPNVRQPEDLAPFLAGVAEDVSGTVALAGDIAWGPDGVTSDLELLLRDVSATTSVATIERLNGVIAVDGLLPFSTPPGQQVAVAAIDAGLPLTNGLLTFRIAPGPRLEIAEGELHLAGGTVNLEPLTYDPRAGSNPAVLTVRGVDLGQLLALAQLEGLTGTGRLSGRIPVRLVPGDLVIEGGTLEAEGPGTLSYAPLVPPAALQGQHEAVSLALSALTDFRYEQLRLSVDRQAGGEMTVGMHIRGSNPDFYDGYPVEFNLNLSGALDRVLRQSLAGYRIPEAIEQQLQEFTQ